MKTSIVGLFFFIVSTSWSFAQNSVTEQEIIKLSKDKWQWMPEKDVDALDDQFHEKSVFFHMGGSWAKEREINIIKSGGIWYKKADINKVLVNITLSAKLLFY